MSTTTRVGIGHIGLEISSLKKSLDFYGPLFKATGFRKVWRAKEVAGFSNGDFMIFIGLSKPRRVVRKKPSGNESIISDHLALRANGRNVVDTVSAALERAGFRPLFPAAEHREFMAGYYAVSFCDPDNNVIEVYTVPRRK